MNTAKIDPRLRITLASTRERGLAGLVRHQRLMGFVSKEGSPKPPRAILFVQCAEDADLTHLEDEGVLVNQRSGRFRTAFLPIDAIGRLSEEPGVVRIYPSSRLRYRMDVACAKVNLLPFTRKSGLSGKGVIVGIVDSGIDPRHAAFAGRILRIWDQVQSGPGVEEGTYGVELAGDRITDSLDTDGHGTHVAGIAAGKDALFGGVAPGADLVVVRTDLDNAHIADGVRYVFRVGRELDRPVAINLSMGAHYDPHDGTDPLSQIIDQESGAGRIVCCAAGNEGTDHIHAQEEVAGGEEKEIEFRVPVSNPLHENVVWLNGWYSAEDRMEVALVSPKGFETPYQGITGAETDPATFTLGDTSVTIATQESGGSDDDRNFLVLLESATGRRVNPGLWRLKLRGVQVARGRVDVWSITDMREPVRFTGTSANDRTKIGSPGAAKSAVTVAAYITKVAWSDAGGGEHVAEMVVDSIADFSSEGPLRDGFQKPDVAAPGGLIASARSRDSSVPPEYLVAEGWRLMHGTSQAAPFVTGLVALLLEQNPGLDPDSVKEALRGICTIPGCAPGSADSKWGYGLIDAGRLP